MGWRELLAKIPAFLRERREKRILEFRERRRKLILNSPEYQFMAQDAAEREAAEKTARRAAEKQYQEAVDAFEKNLAYVPEGQEDIPLARRLDIQLGGLKTVAHEERIGRMKATSETRQVRKSAEKAAEQSLRKIGEAERSLRESQEALREVTRTKEFLESYAESVDHPVIAITDSGLVAYSNKVALANPHLALEDDFFQRSFPTREYFDRFIEYIQSLGDKKSPETYLAFGRGNQGNYMITASPAYSEGGAPIGRVISIREETKDETKKRERGERPTLLDTIFRRRKSTQEIPDTELGTERA